MAAIVVSADKIKSEMSGYKPEFAELFHQESAKLADEKFDKLLKESSYTDVILMSGGPASGKTEYVSAYLQDNEAIIFDGILPTEEGIKIKLSHIKKSGKKAEIHAVWPADLKDAYTAFLRRDRKFNDKHFYEKHAHSRQALLWATENYPDILIKMFESSYEQGALTFSEVSATTRVELVEFIMKNQYNIESIRRMVKGI